MIKAGRVFHGLSFFVLCASQHICWDASSRCAADSSCIISALGGGTCVCISVCQVLIPSGFLPRSWRSGSCWQAGIRWARGPVLADLSASAWGESWREPHTLWLCEEALITTMGIGLTYVTHWWDMNSPNSLSWTGTGDRKRSYTCCWTAVFYLYDIHYRT